VHDANEGLLQDSLKQTLRVLLKKGKPSLLYQEVSFSQAHPNNSIFLAHAWAIFDVVAIFIGPYWPFCGKIPGTGTRLIYDMI